MTFPVHAGDAEIDDLGRSVGLNHHVRRFDVAMNDPAMVGISERVANLLDDAQLVDQQQLPARADQLVHGFATDELHDDEGHSVFVAEIVDGDNVRVLQDAGLGLAVKTLQHLRLAREALGQRLDGHLAADALVLGAVNNAHASAAQDARGLVLADLLFLCQIHVFRKVSLSMKSEGNGSAQIR